MAVPTLLCNSECWVPRQDDIESLKTTDMNPRQLSLLNWTDHVLRTHPNGPTKKVVGYPPRGTEAAMVKFGTGKMPKRGKANNDRDD